MSVIIYQSQLQGTGTRYLLSNYLRGNWRCITYKRKASPSICDVILFCHKLLQSPGLNLSLCKLRKGTYKVRSMISLKFNKINSSIHFVTTHRRAFRGVPLNTATTYLPGLFWATFWSPTASLDFLGFFFLLLSKI